MRTINNYSLTLVSVISTFALFSIVLILNSQSVYSKNPEVSYLDVNDSSSVSKFSVAAWFKTSNNYKSDAYIVNKDGDGGNMNYGMWMTGDEKISGGFETSSGKPIYATSPISYSDGKWHYAVVTFDGKVINLYLDGTLVATQPASGSPDNGGNEPVRVGADSTKPDDYFIGDVDEIRVWDSALTDQQVVDAYHNNFDTKNQVLYLDFSQPIIALNETLPVNQTALNQTALNQTALNQTALNQTNANVTEILGSNETGANVTEIQGSNLTRGNERSSNATNFVTDNRTRNANVTNENIQAKGLQNNNETGITNETLIENQTENNVPMAFDQSVSVDQNSQKEITLGANDEDKSQLQFDVTADPQHGTLDNFNKQKGTVTYVPQNNYSGDDKFSFKATDNKGGESQPANVDIQINSASQLNETNKNLQPIEKSQTKNNTGITNETLIENQTSKSKPSEENSLPKAFDQSISIDQNSRSDITLAAEDDDKDRLQYDITADPLHGK